MRLRSMHQNNYEDKIKGLPDFLQVLHLKPPKKQLHPSQNHNDSQYESILVPYDRKNRYAINADTGSQSESDSQVIQMLKDPKIQCQNLNKRILEARKNQNSAQILYDILIKYISIVNPIKELKYLQPLIDSLSCSFHEIQPLISKINNKLCQVLVYQKFNVLGKAFDALLYFIKSLLFCAKEKRKNSFQKLNAIKQSDLKDCFLKILKICQKQFWQSRKQTNFINLLQNVQVFIESSYEMQVNKNIGDSLIDFLILVIKKICSNLSPRMIKNSFFEKHSIKLNDELFILLSEEFFLTLRNNQPFYKVAWKCFQISDKRIKQSKKDKQKRGITVNKICNFCHISLFEDNLIKVYGCGHSFHSYCDGQKQQCIECSYASDQKLFENFIFSKVYKKQLQQNTKAYTKKKQQTIKFHNDSKEQKLFYLKRKFKIYDYQQYSKQKTTMNLMQNLEN